MTAIDGALTLSLDGRRRHALNRLDDRRFVVHAGRDAIVVDRSESRRIASIGDVSAVAISDDGRFIAIGEKYSSNTTPIVAIYETSDDNSITKVAELIGGAKHRYDAIDFDRDSKLLATVVNPVSRSHRVLADAVGQRES